MRIKDFKTWSNAQEIYVVQLVVLTKILLENSDIYFDRSTIGRLQRRTHRRTHWHTLPFKLQLHRQLIPENIFDVERRQGFGFFISVFCLKRGRRLLDLISFDAQSATPKKIPCDALENSILCLGSLEVFGKTKKPSLTTV